MSNGNETTWDGGTTLWDVDLQGPGTRTVWDLLPDFLKIDELARVVPSNWLARVNPANWIARIRR